ncbi:hypothetical protein [Streptosporangium sp. NPDC002524]|uniref:hypothetical protein n=1 Tax=Streptosporangium sp. NPDC002524 TaxID=3154537 RepID=UPI00332EC687
MTTPLDMDPAVRDAVKDLADAEQLYEELKEKVVDGEDVTPRDLAEHRELIDFAALMIDSTKKKVTAARAEDRQRRYIELGDELATFTAGSQDVEDALIAATAALRHLLDVGETRRQRMKDIASRGAALRQEARDHGEESDLKNAGVWASDAENGIVYRRVENGELTYRRRMLLHPAHLAALAIRNSVISHNLDRGITYMEWPESSMSAGRWAAREFPAAAGPTMPGHAEWPGQ